MTLERFRDLVFSPLALPVPPALNILRLIEWMTWARGEAHKRGLNKPERGYEENTGRQYPWLMATVSYATPSHVEESFEREFPELRRYADHFPLKQVGLIALIAQRGNADVYLHTDSDGYWGFRFYLATARRESLYFCLTRDADQALPSRANNWSPFVDLERRHYAKWPHDNRPFCVNSKRAAHAVDANTCALGDRVACLVMPRDSLDEPRLLALLEESTARFGDHQLWWQGPAKPAAVAVDTLDEPILQPRSL
jgi:hypothetical protein